MVRLQFGGTEGVGAQTRDELDGSDGGGDYEDEGRGVEDQVVEDCGCGCEGWGWGWEAEGEGC